MIARFRCCDSVNQTWIELLQPGEPIWGEARAALFDKRLWNLSFLILFWKEMLQMC